VIARTEIIGASNLGSRAAAKETGLQLEKEWIATPDKRTRKAHKAANGQTRDFDEPYIVWGDRLQFPGDTSHGAKLRNVIQCRCVEGYHVKGG
ncbi:phage minor head protein, partial [Mycobacterium tuberculosis]|uniref:phage minor head protein n=1 Tax=Mycobacterium tuberculosis TaxID=1773 RepID=UPI001BE06DD4